MIARNIAVAAVSLLMLTAIPAMAADPPIRISVGGIEKQIHLPEVLAERLGFFKAQGLNVELVNSGNSGVNAESELIAGAVEAVSSSYDHAIDLQSKGKYVTTIVQFIGAPGEVELVGSQFASELKSPADFKGRTLGVSGLGAMTDFLTRALAARADLKGGQFSLLAVGAGNSFIAAMRQGQIQAGMTTEPTVSKLVNAGQAKILADLRTPDSTVAALGSPYMGDSLYVSAAWLNDHHAEAQKLANAFVATMHWIQSHTAEQIADVVPKDYIGPDKAAYVKILAASKAMFTPDGRMPNGAPESELRILSEFNPHLAGKSIDLSKTYSNEFVDAANTQG
jgi:NitT/TauT family transport system substrate-binding protein